MLINNNKWTNCDIVMSQDNIPPQQQTTDTQNMDKLQTLLCQVWEAKQQKNMYSMILVLWDRRTGEINP